MRKSAISATLCFCIAGVVGFFLRRYEMSTVFDAETMLAQRGETVTVVLAALSVAAVAAAVVFAAVRIGRRKTACVFTAVAPDNLLGTGALLLAALAVFCGGVIGLVKGDMFPWRGVTLIFSVFAAASGVAFALIAMWGKKRQTGSGAQVVSVIPPLFFSLWLIVEFRANAAEPELLVYCYACIADAAMAFAAYSEAGYFCGVSKPGQTAAAGLAALFFGIVALADYSSMPIFLIRIGALLAQLAIVPQFMRCALRDGGAEK